MASDCKLWNKLDVLLSSNENAAAWLMTDSHLWTRPALNIVEHARMTRDVLNCRAIDFIGMGIPQCD